MSNLRHVYSGRGQFENDKRKLKNGKILGLIPGTVESMEYKIDV